MGFFPQNWGKVFQITYTGFHSLQKISHSHTTTEKDFNICSSLTTQYFINFPFHFFSTLILVFIKTSLFTLLVWKNSDFRYPLQDHFPALQPGGELNPLPVWRRSTELLKLYRSTELVQCALSSHRHHWDCRARGSGSAAWNTKEIINCTKCSISLVPFTSSYRWGRSTKAPGLLQSPWALCSSLHLLEVQL